MKYLKLIIVTLKIPFLTYGAYLGNPDTQVDPHEFGTPRPPFGVSKQGNAVPLLRQTDIREFLAADESQSPIPVLPTEASIQAAADKAAREQRKKQRDLDTAAPVVAGSKRRDRETDSDDEDRTAAHVSDVETSEDQSCHGKGSSRASSPLSMGADSVEVSAGTGSQSDVMTDGDSVEVSAGTGSQSDAMTDGEDKEDYVQKMGLEYATAEEAIRSQLDALPSFPTAESLAIIDKIILSYPCFEAIPSMILKKYYPHIIHGTKSYMEIYAKRRLQYPHIPLTFSDRELPYGTLVNKLRELGIYTFPVQTDRTTEPDNLLYLSPDEYVDPAILALKDALEDWLAEEDMPSSPDSPAR